MFSILRLRVFIFQNENYEKICCLCILCNHEFDLGFQKNFNLVHREANEISLIMFEINPNPFGMLVRVV